MSKALSWLHEKQEAQARLNKTDAPLLTAADIKKKQDTLQRFAEPIMSKAAPPPPVWLHAFLILSAGKMYDFGISAIGLLAVLIKIQRAPKRVPRGHEPVPGVFISSSSMAWNGFNLWSKPIVIWCCPVGLLSKGCAAGMRPLRLAS